MHVKFSELLGLTAVTNTPLFLHKMNKSVPSYAPPHCATQSEKLFEMLSKWPEILMAQHIELGFEIDSVNGLLNTKSCNLIQLDVSLKKLTKAVLIHLELEAQFLVPTLASTKVLAQHTNYMSEGFDALFEICQATTVYVHSLKLDFGNCLVTDKQSEHIAYFLDEIKNRLNDEDVIYSQMTNKGINHAI